MEVRSLLSGAAAVSKYGRRRTYREGVEACPWDAVVLAAPAAPVAHAAGLRPEAHAQCPIGVCSKAKNGYDEGCSKGLRRGAHLLTLQQLCSLLLLPPCTVDYITFNPIVHKQTSVPLHALARLLKATASLL